MSATSSDSLLCAVHEICKTVAELRLARVQNEVLTRSLEQRDKEIERLTEERDVLKLLMSMLTVSSSSSAEKKDGVEPRHEADDDNEYRP